MKQFLLVIMFVSFSAALHAQMPKAINYQAVARNNSGQALANQNIKVRLSIVNTSAGNATLYSETRNVTTNALGLFNVQIGSAGAIATSGNFAGINWANNTSSTEALKVELDINNSGAFTEMGIQSLVTVPYAFAADQAVNANNIGGHFVDTNTPNKGDVLRWNGTAWVSQPPSKVYRLTGAPNVVNGGSLAFVWAFQPISITVYEGQTITFVASGTLGASSGTAISVGLSPCFQAVGGTITSFYPISYTTEASISGRRIIPVSGTLRVVASNANNNAGEINAGTYFFGYGIRNTSATTLNAIDAINGFIQVQ